MADDRKPPQIDNAPGLTWRPQKNGWEARWRARTDLVQRGFTPSSTMIWSGEYPDETTMAFIASRCQALQEEMKEFGRGGLPEVGTYDGTWGGLSQCYQTDRDSPFRKARYITRQNYLSLLRRVERDHGDELVEETKARTIRRWHEEWAEGGKISSGHALVGMLRTLCGFGATILEDEACERLSALLHRMRFETTKQRNKFLTADHAIAIRAAAHRKGLPSIALAQAFQFELMLRQKDVIGEYVPLGEPGTTDILLLTGKKKKHGHKWLRGIRWNEIDEHMIIKHVTSKRQKMLEVDLTLAGMVMEELKLMVGKDVVTRADFPAVGPIIIFEESGMPFTGHQFRYQWRKLATAAGVPKDVFNMDSRAGGITEATTAGADLDHVRHAATHGDVAMTQKYSRGDVEKTAGVMKLRATHRNKNST